MNDRKPAIGLGVEHDVKLDERWRANGHRSAILWFTGLPGAGKTTLALGLERTLFNRGYQTYMLDGDNLRHGLSCDLGFSEKDRSENTRRVAEVARLFADSGAVVIAAFISPYRADRQRCRAIGGPFFHEVFIDSPIEVCEARDPKGHYARARRGEIPHFTGVSAPYEKPSSPEVHVKTAELSVQQSVHLLLDYVVRCFQSGGGRLQNQGPDA